jgi:hypothetical protein
MPVSLLRAPQHDYHPIVSPDNEAISVYLGNFDLDSPGVYTTT